MLMVFLQVSRSSAQRKKLSLSLVDYTAIQNFNINPIQDGEGGGGKLWSHDHIYNIIWITW